MREKKNRKSPWLFFCIAVHKQTLVKVGSAIYACHAYAQQIPAHLQRGSGKINAKSKKNKIENRKIGESSSGFVKGLQNGRRMQTPKLGEFCEMAVN